MKGELFMKRIDKLFSLLLSALITVLIIPLDSFTVGAVAYIKDSGKCGDNLTWRYSEGTMYISGTGDMYDYNFASRDDERWVTGIYSYKNFKNVIIKEGVTSIGAKAFYDNKYLEYVSLPSTMKKISGSAFTGCSELKKINVAKLQTWVSMDFTDSPFWRNVNLYINGTEATDIEIPDNITEIKKYNFYNFSNIKSIKFPDSLTAIGDYAFCGCSNISEIFMPSNVTNIGTSAFENCTGIKIVNISDLDSWYKIKFNGGLSNPLAYAKNLYINNKLVTDIEIPNNISKINDYAFYNCESIKTVTIPENIKEIGYCAFLSCTEIEKVNTADLTAWCKIKFNDSCSNPLYYGKRLYVNNELKSDIVLPYGITTINPYTFYNCESIKSIVLPKGLINIGDYAFYNCKSLTTIFFPESLKTIGNAAFVNCGLKNIWYCDSETERTNIQGEGLNEAYWYYNKCSINKEHVYNNDCDKICNVCKHVRAVPNHVYDNECDAFCNICGFKRTPPHIYSNACDSTCNMCGYVRSVPDHVYDNACDTTCNICGYVRSVPDHIYDNACDADCNICGFIRIAPHVYDNECDTTCNNCGHLRDITHTYSNVCDAFCNICGFERIPPHEYTNACDTDCNLCGFIRIAPHKYTNACDTDCNLCGYKRITSHKYSNACDEYCNICNHKRTAPHVYKNDCSRQCSRCRQYRTIKHTYEKNPIWSYDSNKHWQRCYVCNILTDKDNHIYDNDSDPTCNTCGYVRILDKGFYPDSAIEIRHLKTVPRGYTGIYDYIDLQKINKNPSGNYILMKDINLYTYTGLSSSIISKDFTGVFNGNGYTISSLSISQDINSNAGAGLFSHNKGIICNLKIEKAYIACVTANTKSSAVSGIIAMQNSGNIRNCIVYNSTIAGNGGTEIITGGIVGKNNRSGAIQYCMVIRDIGNPQPILAIGNSNSKTPISYSGGICGINYGTINCCENQAGVNAESRYYAYSGGIVGYNNNKISNCINRGIVLFDNKTNNYYASIVGKNDSSGIIENAYSGDMGFCAESGNTNNRVNLAVFKNSGKVNECYIENSLYAPAEGDEGIKCPHDQMTSKETYKGFDFDNVWIMGTYPELRSYNYSECVNGANHSGGKATCQGQAVCEICGVYYGKKADHTYTEWQTAYEANCSRAGLKVHHCLYCGLEEETQIAVNNKHVYTEGDDDCTLCGHKYTSVIGDTNGDEVINGKDVVHLCNYLANYDYETEKSTVDIFEEADANGDGEINGKDVIILCNYLANFDYETGKSTVELGKGSKRK